MRTRTMAATTTALLLALGALGAEKKAPPRGSKGDPLPAALRAFDAFYRESVQRYGIVGSGIALVHDNKVVDQQTFGMAHIEEKRPVDADTIYHWASITKTITGMAILQLRDRGRLRLEDRIVDYLPELRRVHDPQGAIGDVTLRQLLSHTAGFRAATFPWGGGEPWHPHEPRDWAQVAAMLPYTELLFRPGSRYAYSNPGVVMLGRVIEAVSGDDYEVYVEKNIFKPLEMHRSYFDATPYHLRRHRSHSYRRKGDTLTPARFDADTGVTVSNGGLNAPLPDMVRYLSFLMGSRDPARQALCDEVLKHASLEEMWVPVAAVPSPADGRERSDHVGLAFFIEDNFGQRFIAHSGHQNAFLTHLYLNPAARAGYLVAYNTEVSSTPESPRTTGTLDREIKEYLFERVLPLFSR